MSNLFDLTGKIALVTGGAGHLGFPMSEALAQSGAHVLINSRCAKKASQAAEKLCVQGYKASPVAFDITNESEMEHTILPILDKFGELSILVNNAYSGDSKKIEEINKLDFARSYNVAVSSAFNLFQICLPYLRKASKQQYASVINIASMYGVVSPDHRIYAESGMDNPVYYGAAKASLLQITKILACRYAKENIRINAISPGPFPPDEVTSKSKSFFESLCEKVPMDRIGEKNEMKGPLLFLASNASSYVTGTNLIVDGGWCAW